MTREEAMKLWVDAGGDMAHELDAYAELTSPGWAYAIAGHVPPYMRGGLLRWILFGVMPGEFLQAVLRGDLFDALRRADDTNKDLLWDYGYALYNGAPSACYGSPETVKRWRGMYPYIDRYAIFDSMDRQLSDMVTDRTKLSKLLRDLEVSEAENHGRMTYAIGLIREDGSVTFDC